MAAILNIETATQLCSVALVVDGNTVSRRVTLEDKSHASKLTVFISEVLQEYKHKVAELDAVAVGKGPGSYTGLRIGVSTAKGLCYGANIPLIAVGTLKVLYQQVLIHPDPMLQKILSGTDVLLCPMIDARRMEVFTCMFNLNGEVIEPPAAKIIDPETFTKHLNEHTIIFFGSGMEKCRKLLTDQHCVCVSDVYPHADALAMLAEKKFVQGKFEDVAYFEPFYLKDFIATTPKKNITV